MPLSAQKSRVLVGDYHLSTYLTGVQENFTVDMLDHSCLTDTAKVFLPSQDTSTFSLSGLLDSDGTGLFDQLTDWKVNDVPEPLSYGPSGFALGSFVFQARSLVSTLSISSAVAGRNEFTLNTQTDGITDLGISLHDLTAETGTVNGSSHDGAASSAGGGLAQLHVTAFSGTNATIILEHSANDSTWATLASFSSVTAVGAQRVAATGTVNRYLRAAVTGGTFSSVTFQASFARR